jgi:glycerol-3-phosphate dehydrogenase
VTSWAPTSDKNRRANLFQKAEVHESSTGMITITGGRLTTWRRTAKLVLDLVVARDKDRGAPCRTHEIPLGAPVDLRELPCVAGIPDGAYRQLADRYGYAAREILSIAGDVTGLQDPIVPGLPDLLAEVVFSARHEQANSLGDLLLRRTRLGLIAGTELGADGAVAERVAQVMGQELGWDEQEVSRQLDAWNSEATAEGVVVSA